MRTLKKILCQENCIAIVERLSVWLLVIMCFVAKNGYSQYKGSASVSQGKATTVISNLYTCTGGRLAGVGTIKSTDGKSWTVPALTNFNNLVFPWALDLNNPCSGNNFKSIKEATAGLTGQEIVNIDSDGEVITAYIFADNYFELYINGKPVGKDNVPFTQFNSNLVRFKVKQPFVAAMMLVDWEENLGLGSELNGGFTYHPGDGGVVAVFQNEQGELIGKTDQTWKAQTFYTSPIMDLSCPSENGQNRSTSLCSTIDSKDGSMYYALHWELPVNWMDSKFDDGAWPNASEFSNVVIGVDNKPAYTNFVDVFDNDSFDAKFIWSSNVILDNQVVVRGVIGLNNAQAKSPQKFGLLYPNPSIDNIDVLCADKSMLFKQLEIYSQLGHLIKTIDNPSFPFSLKPIVSPGKYYIRLCTNYGDIIQSIEYVLPQ
jgi:hypothetical protein